MESIVIDRPLNQILEFIPELKTLTESLDIGVVLKEIEGRIINKNKLKKKQKIKILLLKVFLKIMIKLLFNSKIFKKRDIVRII